MRAVVQRVLEARVDVGDRTAGAIGCGLLAYVGLGRGDGPEERSWVLSKIVGLRVFDHEGKMARSVLDAGGALLLVSQFTLYADVLRGRRPSFDAAMPPIEAEAAYDAFVREARNVEGLRVETGIFRADMRVVAVHDGPVTIWIDSATRARSRSPASGTRSDGR